MQNKYTSLELSKWLHEKDFEKKPTMIWDWNGSEYKLIPNINNISMFFGDATYPAYDILNDLCVKYGENYIFEGSAEEKFTHMGMVLHMLISGKKEEAETYIMENSLLLK